MIEGCRDDDTASDENERRANIRGTQEENEPWGPESPPLLPPVAAAAASAGFPPPIAGVAAASLADTIRPKFQLNISFLISLRCALTLYCEAIDSIEPLQVVAVEVLNRARSVFPPFVVAMDIFLFDEFAVHHKTVVISDHSGRGVR